MNITRTPVRDVAKQFAKKLKKEQPDYNYLKEIFRHIRAELDVKVNVGTPKKLPYVPTERKILQKYTDEAGIEHSISPHKLRHFLFTWMKKQGVDDALMQPYSGHESRKSLEIYSKLSLGDCQEEYEHQIKSFPI